MPGSPTILQPDALTSNTPKPLTGLNVGEIYSAVNPFGFPGPLYVMYIQAAETIASRGLAVRQECSILASEGALSSTSGTTTSIVDTDHSIGAGTCLTDFDTGKTGYKAWVDDATTTYHEIADVYYNNSTGFYLGNEQKLNDAVVTDKYIVWKPGRMKFPATNGTDEKVWGITCAAITDEYFGFMVVKGWWVGVCDSSTGANAVAGGGMVYGAAGVLEGVTVGTDDNVLCAVSMHATAALNYPPIYVNTHLI